MLMWADVEREWGLDHPMADPKKVGEARDELRTILRSSQRRPDQAVSDLDEFRRALGPRRAAPVEAPSVDPDGDLAQMREMMAKRGSSD